MNDNKRVPLLPIFASMFYIGAFTFGGGLSMIPQMTRVFVSKRRWVEERDIVDMFAVAQSLPGVIAVNASILVGYRLRGLSGALMAALGSILPSFLVLMVVTLAYESFLHNEIVLGVLRGVRAAVVALLFSTVWRLRKSSLTGVFGCALFAAALVCTVWLRVNPVWLLLGGAFLGFSAVFVRTKMGAPKEGR